MRPPRDRSRGGYALLVVLAVVGAVALVGLTTAGRRDLASRGDRLAVSEERVAAVGLAAARAYRRDGAFPADLRALGAAGVAPSIELRAGDPFGQGLDLDYAPGPTSARVTARGPDGALSTADDLVMDTSANVGGRAATRNRLRVLRALFLQSAYMSDPGMTAAERLALATAVRGWSQARRQWLYADAAGRLLLQAQMDAAELVISTLATAYALPPVPPAATGPGGLLSMMGLPDALGTDGFGHPLQTGPAGFSSPGADGTPGNDDDL